MATNLSTVNTPLAGIHDYQSLILGPLLETSRVLQYVRIIQTGSSVVHLPTGKAASTNWYAENQEIVQSDDLVDEITVTPRKVASLALLSNELAADTSPGAVESVGSIIVNSVAAETDRAFFLGSGVPPEPAGIGTVVGTATLPGAELVAGSFAEAIALVEEEGGNASICWANPADWATVATSLTAHAAVAPVGGLIRNVLGVEVVTSKHCPAGTLWVADASLIVAVIRSDGEVAVSTDARFTSDSTLVRVTSRIGYAYPMPTTICKVTVA